ncbi:acetyltransferase [Blastococcus sp. SYSU DS0510]
MTVPQPLVVIGAGGFGREALDVVEAVNAVGPRPVFDVQGVVDDAPSEINLRRLAARGIPYLGPLDLAVAELRDGSAYVLGIGSPTVRARLDVELAGMGLDQPTVVHPRAGIGSMTQVAPGAVICAGVQVSTNVIMGRSVHLNPNATVGHDAVIGDFASVNPGAVISGDCTVGAGSLIGAGAVVLQGLTVGPWSLVGAGACVTRNVDSHTKVKGVPAR